MSAHSERINGIVIGISAAQARFSEAFKSTSDAAALLPGPHGGWSAAEIAMHVAITNEWIAGVLNGEIQAAQPAPAGFTENWNAIVIPARAQTFPALVPPVGVTRQQALNRLGNADAQVVQAARELDEARALHVVMLPFGTLSLYQIAEFASMHTNRHLEQLHRLEVATPVEC
jgi:hypothetical protein